MLPYDGDDEGVCCRSHGELVSVTFDNSYEEHIVGSQPASPSVSSSSTCCSQSSLSPSSDSDDTASISSSPSDISVSSSTSSPPSASSSDGEYDRYRHSVTVRRARGVSSHIDADGYDSQGSPVGDTSDGEADGAEQDLSDGYFSDRDMDTSKSNLQYRTMHAIEYP